MSDGSITPERYDRTTIVLHWAIALVVVLQWGGAHTIDWFPKGAYRVDARSMHILFGVLLTVALAYRIVWRLRAGTRFPRKRGSVIAAAAGAVHYALYAVLLTVLGLGLFNTWLRGDSLFGLFAVPKFGFYDVGARHAMVEQIVGLHETSSNILLILAGGHALAGLVHHFVLNDAVLGRMKL
jgi:cytochrome b561